MMKRIVSLLPSGTEIAAALGLMEEVVGVSHECDFPPAANERPRVTHCTIHRAGLTSKEVDYWVRTTLQERGTLYTIDEPLLRRLQPDIILTQQLCDVCAVGYGTVARLAATLPVPPRLVNLEPSSLADIFNDIRRVAEACAVPERGSEVVRRLNARVESVRRRAAGANRQRKCSLMEWVQPPFSSGHWGPELIELAGGYDSLGRKWQPSVGLAWEQIVEAQPEVIILALCGYDIERAEKDYEVLRAFPGFADLPAARHNEIYLTDASSYFARPGPRTVDSLEIVAGILHPELFPEFAPSATIRHKARRASSS